MPKILDRPYFVSDKIKDSSNNGVITSLDMFDLVIRTQSEFDLMVNSATWLDVTSVALIGGNTGSVPGLNNTGDGTDFVAPLNNNYGLKVPNNVKRIDGYNDAIISIQNYVFSPLSGMLGGLYYSPSRTSNDYSINNITIRAYSNSSGPALIGMGAVYGFTNMTNINVIMNTTATSGQDATGFVSCSNLYNCKATCTATMSSGSTANAIGYRDCSFLYKCSAMTFVPNNYGPNIGFQTCNNLYSCTQSNTAGLSATGFNSCNKLVNCVGSTNGGSSSIVFNNCTSLTNCSVSSLASAGTANGYTNCTELNNCIMDISKTGPCTGFYLCKRLVNCYGNAYSIGASTPYSGFGFNNCESLVNCIGTGRTDGLSASFGFDKCSSLIGCTSGASPSTTATFNNCTNIQQGYDLVISTQADFDKVISSNVLNSTTNAPKSVAIVGQFTLSTSNNPGIKLDLSVRKVVGFPTAAGKAKITITNFIYNASPASPPTSTGGLGGIWYASLPTGVGHSITDLDVECTYVTSAGLSTTTRTFVNCTNLTNCTGAGIGAGGSSASVGVGFYSCKKLYNCIGTGIGINANSSMGFDTCEDLYSCSGTGSGAILGGYGGVGFYNCINLINCIGNGSGTNNGTGYGFNQCKQLINCEGIGTGDGGMSITSGFLNCNNLSNCFGTASGTNNITGYSFSSCTSLVNCSFKTAPATAVFNQCKEICSSKTTNFIQGITVKSNLIPLINSKNIVATINFFTPSVLQIGSSADSTITFYGGTSGTTNLLSLVTNRDRAVTIKLYISRNSLTSVSVSYMVLHTSQAGTLEAYSEGNMIPNVTVPGTSTTLTVAMTDNFSVGWDLLSSRMVWVETDIGYY